MELIDQLSNLTNSLNASIKSLRVTGNAKAETERAYKVKLREEVMKLRDEGTAIGMISLVAYGIPSVAELRFKRDIAEMNYQANLEAINSYKLQIRIIENSISREWGNSN